jgi:hypothetical protein
MFARLKNKQHDVDGIILSIQDSNFLPNNFATLIANISLTANDKDAIGVALYIKALNYYTDMKKVITLATYSLGNNIQRTTDEYMKYSQHVKDTLNLAVSYGNRDAAQFASDNKIIIEVSAEIEPDHKNRRCLIM